MFLQLSVSSMSKLPLGSLLLILGSCTIICLITLGSVDPLSAAPYEQDESASASPTPSITPSPTNSETVTPSQTSTTSPTKSIEATNTSTPTYTVTSPPSDTPSPSPFPSPTITPSGSTTPTTTMSASNTPSQQPAIQPQISSLNTASFDTLAVLINEIAWAGTSASSSDEWIELYNPGQESINLSG